MEREDRRERKGEREDWRERGRDDALNHIPSRLVHFTLFQSLLALPAGYCSQATVCTSLFLKTAPAGGILTDFFNLCFTCSFYTYDRNTAALRSVSVDEQTTRYTYSFNGDLTSIIYPTSTTVKYSWNQYGLLSNITGYNQENKFVQGMYFSYDWNGKVIMSRLPQGDSAVLMFNEEGRMMDIVGEGLSDLQFDSVKDDDQVVRVIKQGEQVLRFLNDFDLMSRCQTT